MIRRSWSVKLFLPPRKYLLQRVLTFASKQTPCLNTSSLCMGILKSCASSTKLYLVTPGIALMTADSLQSSCFTTALEEATCRYAHLLRRCSLRTTDASLRRSSGLRRTGRDGLVGWWVQLTRWSVIGVSTYWPPRSGLRHDGQAVRTAATAAGVPMTHGSQHVVFFLEAPRRQSQH